MTDYNYDLCEEKSGSSFTRATPDFSNIASSGYLLVTLKYPHTQSFLKKQSAAQKMIYKKIWENIKHPFDIVDSDIKYEYYASGQIHAHGYIQLDDTKRYVNGTVCDLVKRWLEYLPKKYQKYNEKNYRDDWCRFTCNSICVQYKPIGDPYFNDWIHYMNKDQIV